MKNNILALNLCLIPLLFTGCICLGPRWSKSYLQVSSDDLEIKEFINIDSDSTYIVGKGIIESESESIAYQAARDQGMKNISENIVTHVQSHVQSIIIETGNNKQSAINDFFKSVSEVSSNMVLTDCRELKIVRRVYAKKKDVIYKYFVAVGYPRGGADETLLENIRKNRNIYQNLDTLNSIKTLILKVDQWREGNKAAWEKEPLDFPNKIKMVDNIIFDMGVTDIFKNDEYKKQNLTILDDFVSYIEIIPGYKRIEVHGHADTTPPHPDETRTLIEFALERAESVKDYLVKQKKIDRNKIDTFGLGTVLPMFPNISTEFKWMNRRVEIYVVF